MKIGDRKIICGVELEAVPEEEENNCCGCFLEDMGAFKCKGVGCTDGKFILKEVK